MTGQNGWDTASLPVDEQFAFWGDAVNQAFTTVQVSRGGDGAFFSSIQAAQIGPLRVARIVSQSQSVFRVADDIARDPGDVVFLNLPLAPGTAASQDGRTAHLAAGDFAVVDALRPFELAFSAPFEQVSVIVPREALAEPLAARPELTATRVDGSTGIGAVASAAVRALSRTGTATDRQALRATADHVIGLVALSLGSVPAFAATPRELLLAAALDELDRSLPDPALTPDRIADQLGISTRYLQRLFAERGDSFTEALRTRRLARCRADLLDPARRHWSIAQIALEHGFTDPSYMARAFKRHYGLSPRALRPSASAT